MDSEELRKFRLRTRVPKTLSTLEVSDMDLSGDGSYRGALRRAEDLGDRLGEGTFPDNPLFLRIEGPFGAGKTRVAVWLLRRAYEGLLREKATWIDGLRTPLFVRTSALVEYRFRARGEDEEVEDWNRFRRRIFESALLVVDDLGRIADYRGETVFLERVVEERFEEGLSTILTYNLSPEKILAISERFADYLEPFDLLTLVGSTRKERFGT